MQFLDVSYGDMDRRSQILSELRKCKSTGGVIYPDDFVKQMSILKFNLPNEPLKENYTDDEIEIELNNAKKFVKDYLYTTDNVSYIPVIKSKYENKRIFFSTRDLEDYMYITIDLMSNEEKKRRLKFVNVLDVPCFVTSRSSGAVNLQYLGDEIGNVIEYYQFTTCIAMGENCIIFPDYVHEATHSLINSQEGCLEEFIHVETMSHFMGLVSAFISDPSEVTLRKVQMNFLVYLNKKLIPFLKGVNINIIMKDCEQLSNYHRVCSYVIAILESFMLFDIFYNSSMKDRFRMIDDANKVFEGRQTLEDFMNIYGVSKEKALENSYGTVKKVEKTLRKK